MDFVRHIAVEDLPQWKSESGRRVRTDNYPFKADAKERKRLTLQHHLLKLVLGGKNFCAPVTNPARILDVACGTCIWGMEVLQQFPQAHLDNLDIDTILFKRFLESLSPEMKKRFPLQRFRFIQADARKALPFEDGSYDFTHARFPDAFLSWELWPRFLRELVRVTKPDGWVEVVASGVFWFQIPFPAGEELLQASLELTARLNIAPEGGAHLIRFLREIGVTHLQSRVDIAGRTTKQRLLLHKDLYSMLSVGKEFFCEKLGILSPEDFDTKLAAFEQEGVAHRVQMRFHRAWFQPKDQKSLPGMLGNEDTPVSC
jgi:SAM-dependent methyltransferase